MSRSCRYASSPASGSICQSQSPSFFSQSPAVVGPVAIVSECSAIVSRIATQNFAPVGAPSFFSASFLTFALAGSTSSSWISRKSHDAPSE
jgi:hypothetical protein